MRPSRMITNTAGCRQCQNLVRMRYPGHICLRTRTVFSRPMCLVPGSKPGYDHLKSRTLNSNQFSTSNHVFSENSSAEGKAENDQLRFNELNVQMLSRSLHKQIFKRKPEESSRDDNILKEVKKHLEKFNLWNKNTSILPDVDFKLPPLLGADVEEHFYKLGLQQAASYRIQANVLAQNELPPTPKKWVYREGWTRYGPDGSATAVDFPQEDGLVFDIEVLVPEGHCPTMATAASTEAWYSWCSERLIQKRFYWSQNLWTKDLIPMETKKDDVMPANGDWRKKLIIGHNVGFDRSFIKEQYYPKGPRTRFLDTMSLHIATNGLTNQQRMLFMAKKKGSQRKEVREAMSNPFFGESPMDLEWIDKSSLNNLHDVHQLYTTESPLKKETRNIFVTGTMEAIRDDFQNLMTYCAGDVAATHAVFQKLWPEFEERFPHPVTLAGMLEMSTAYMPVNKNWERYIESSRAIFTSMQHELKVTLMGLANAACQLMHDKGYKDDVWLWDLDWSSRDIRLKKLKVPKGKQNPTTSKERVKQLIEHAENSLPRRPVHMAGYPKWYSEMCPKVSELSEQHVMAGPSLISTQKRVTPRLLRLTWQGYPLHHSARLGWGYLVPGRPLDWDHVELNDELGSQEQEAPDTEPTFPMRSLYDICRPALEREVSRVEVTDELRLEILNALDRGKMDDQEAGGLWRHLAEAGLWKPKNRKKRGTKLQNGPWFHEGDGPYEEVDIAGCWFFKLPHKDGPGNNTGNPLSKQHLTNIETGDLQANCDTNVNQVLKRHVMCSYWKNNEQRIKLQMVVRLRREELPEAVYTDADYEGDLYFGALLPRVVTAGTVTRRAVESTWLTASNARVDRIGSELKAMIQSPPGYKFVGADVDSQELWIAAILGDANFAKTHGCTAFGWMTLLGNKAEKTDLHSRIAMQIGINREQAKIFNYGRIYGAGKRFAVTLLQQFNPKMSPEEAKKKAHDLYAYSKGVRKKYLVPGEEEGDEDMLQFRWDEGTESYMFNVLESIAMSEDPRTPVLGCRISKSLQPKNVDKHFMTSRVNWVVQSSAVDYLHLMLVSMRWLLDEYHIEGRFSISIHDEVRYLVAAAHTDRAALALQVTNLLVRSMFASKMGMYDLPQAVAFFSSVDVDCCLRKEVDMDCQTPSNPRGLHAGYDLPPGEALTIYEVLERTGGSLSRPKQETQTTESACEDFDRAYASAPA